MSSPRLSNRQHKYNDQLWSTYITEAIQSGNAKLYCANKNIPYATYKLKLAEYNKSGDKENWSPNSKRLYSHRVFTDSTEKAAVKQLTEQYISKQKAQSISNMLNNALILFTIDYHIICILQSIHINLSNRTYTLTSTTHHLKRTISLSHTRCTAFNFCIVQVLLLLNPHPINGYIT